MNDTLFNRVRKSLEPSAQACIPACPPACLLAPPKPQHTDHIPSAARLGFQLCVMFILSLESAPTRPPALLWAANCYSCIKFWFQNLLVRPQLPPTVLIQAERTSCLSTCSPMLPSIRPLITGHTSLLNSDSPMMRRTVIYVSWSPNAWQRTGIE